MASGVIYYKHPTHILWSFQRIICIIIQSWAVPKANTTAKSVLLHPDHLTETKCMQVNPFQTLLPPPPHSK